MAKKKRKATTLSKRIKSMSKPRKRRRKATLSASPRRRRKATRRRGLSSAPSTRKPTLIKSLMASGAGALGGVTYQAPKAILKNMPLWQKALWGIAGSTALHMLGYSNVASGHAGAMVADVSRSMFPTFLNDDDDLQDAEYVDADTLNDSGEIDANGNPILIADNGSAYALNENNELEPMGDAYSLNDMDMTSVAMLPLQDAYSLNDRYAI